MRRTSHAIWLILWSVCAGCSDSEEEVAGKAIFTEFSMDGERAFILDTGNDGREYRGLAADHWFVHCWGRDPVKVLVTDNTNFDAPGDERGFYEIFIGWYSDGRVPPHVVNVYLYLNYDRYNGVCQVSLEQTGDDPYAADISVSTCEMESTNARGRLESAQFHLRACSVD